MSQHPVKKPDSTDLLPSLTPEQRRAIALSEMELMDVFSSSDDENITFEGGLFDRNIEPDIVLNAEQTLEFLGLPIRQAYLVKRGDYEKIVMKFKDVLEHFKDTEKGAIEGFWNCLRFRVSNKANIGQRINLDNGSFGKYVGDYVQGGNLRAFVPDCPKSQAHLFYVVQAVEMTINPELKEVLEMHNFTIPNKE